MSSKIYIASGNLDEAWTEAAPEPKEEEGTTDDEIVGKEPEETTEPTNFHHAAVYYTLSPKSTWRQHVRYLTYSAGMVFLQAFAVLAVNVSVAFPGCSTLQPGCQTGFYCYVDKGICMMCLGPESSGLWEATAGGYHDSYYASGLCAGSYDYTAEFEAKLQAANLDKSQNQQRGIWCDSCTEAQSGEFYDIYKVLDDTYRAIGFKEWTTLILSFAVVAATIAKEFHDIMTTEKFADQIMPVDADNELKLWRGVIFVLSVIRQHIVIPLLIDASVQLVQYRGADALNICMNTVAILFLLDIDNVVFDMMDPAKLPTIPTNSKEQLAHIYTGQTCYFSWSFFFLLLQVSLSSALRGLPNFWLVMVIGVGVTFTIIGVPGEETRKTGLRELLRFGLSVTLYVIILLISLGSTMKMEDVFKSMAAYFGSESEDSSRR